MSRPMPAAEDERAIGRLLYLYAQALDRRQRDQLLSLFVPEGKLLGSRVQCIGHKGLATLTDRLARFRKTRHVVHNWIVDVDGDAASGEVYCTAWHVYDDDLGRSKSMNLHIRYHDRYLKRDGVWYFDERQVESDFSQFVDVEAE